MKIASLLPPAVQLDDAASCLRIIDQTRLPGNLVLRELFTLADVFEAIYLLQVRGAPAIGIAAAYGLYLHLKKSAAADKPTLLAELSSAQSYLNSARPTAVNLSWALARMAATAASCNGSPQQIKATLLQEAIAIEAEDAAICRAIGHYGLGLIEDGYSILTHCNAGHLATARYGTALAPIYLALEQGYNLKIYCDETRPLLQGARLTAFELAQVGANVTLLCDNMAASLMAQGEIDAIFVGGDRVAQNGDVANKIGTLGLAVLAKHFGVPFYVCAPSSTIDINCPSGADIIIEQRPAEEVTELMFKERLAPEGINVYNPSFDVTPNQLITAIITERGVVRAPYGFK